ncbi:MAG: FG-GAP-like repeat-containing protein, partial [Catalinimonas sp.]
PFGTEEGRAERDRAALDALPGVKEHNYAFRNRGGLRFEDVSAAWGLQEPTYANGAAYADLDGDGDLDLVINNIDAPATIMENRARELRPDHHYLRVDLAGEAPNRDGFNAKVWVITADSLQYADHTPYRGYKSTVEPTLHFGLGAAARVDTIRVVWPDGRTQTLADVPADQVLTLRQAEATEATPRATKTPAPLFRRAVVPTYRHRETHYVDFNEQPLLPHQHSRNGPGLAVGDVNGDGADDYYVGGTAVGPGALFLQRPDGTFATRTLAKEQRHEDLGVLLFDADGDNDLDLYVVSGSSEFMAGSVAYQDRLYRNDGAGNFTLAPDALPDLKASGAVVTAADWDADGDLDLFVGGRVRPGAYPLAPRSYLLRNDGGRFIDATTQVAPALTEIGMVSAALWTDFDQDGAVDLLLAGEWMPLTFMANRDGRFVNLTDQTGLPDTHGWWNSLTAGDFDNDGDVDYVAGNLGLNTRYRASADEPVCLYAADYDGNGRLDPVLCRYVQGREYPIHPRDAMALQMPGVKRRFPSYAGYADKTYAEMFTDRERRDARVFRATEFRSVYLDNRGDGRFALRALPNEAQLSAIYGLLPGDWDGDGTLDVLLTGNSYAGDPQVGWYDASYGDLLRGDGTGGFTVVPWQEAGVYVPGDTKGSAQLVRADGTSLLLFARNDDSLLAYVPTTPAEGHTVRLNPLDVHAEITLADGRVRRQELYYGSGYLSQSSRVLRVPAGVRSVVVRTSDGRVRSVAPATLLSVAE